MSASDFGLSSAVFGDSIFESVICVVSSAQEQLFQIFSFFTYHPILLLFLLIPLVGLGVGLFRRFLDL